MTDGPFRNSELSSRWKRYGQELVSDATSLDERVLHASHSMLGDVDTKAFKSLLDELRSCSEKSQLDLHPRPIVKEILAKHAPSPLADAFERQLLANLRDQNLTPQLLEKALLATADEWIATTKNRLDEECILARDLHDMSKAEYRKALERNEAVFGAVSAPEIVRALSEGDKQAFRRATQKNESVDAGPEE